MNNLIKYNDGEIELAVSVESETIWLTQKQIAELFEVTKQNISLHTIEIFKSKELDKNSTVKKYLTVQKEGNREVSRELEHYNLDIVYHTGKAGNEYNIGGRNERTNLQIVDRICKLLDEQVPKEKSYKELITFVEDRAGHDRRYAIDATKLENELGWKADETFDTGIVKTVEWYLSKYKV